MSTSSDGGRTWAAPTTGPDRPCVIGGQPVVQPSGTVIVPIDDCFALVTLVRREWRGLSGGTRVWPEIDRFFAALTEHRR